MRLDNVTPMILTWNEEVNIGRTLSKLTWAPRIVVVDSYSDDGTLEIASQFERVVVIQRKFVSFADQCNAGLSAVDTPWVLSLDADYMCTQSLIRSIEELPDTPDANGFVVRFVMAVLGRPLTASLYPPRMVLYRREMAQYRQDGHAHRVSVAGRTGLLAGKIVHDDRKALSAWMAAQIRYAKDEATKLTTASHADLGLIDRLRRSMVTVPMLTPLYCLFVKGLVLDGWPGWYYTAQRTIAELILSLTLLDMRLRAHRKPRPHCEPEEQSHEI